VQDVLQQQQIDQLPWPAYSPDYNPIEHAWDALHRAVRSRDV
jgi:transposase